MSFMELAKKRCAVRSYLDTPVEEEKLMRILEAGRIAPTAKNVQPQRILVLRSKEGLEKVSRAANTYRAPVVLVVCSETKGAWEHPSDGRTTRDVDASIVTDHMMLEATELGLGSVWICSFETEILRREFQLPDHIVPVNLLAIGYPADSLKSPDRFDTERKPLEATAFFEKM